MPAPAAAPALAPAPAPAPAAKPAPASVANPPAVTPEIARTFLKDFVIDPVNLEALEDDKVLELHGTYSTKYGKGNGAWPEDWRDQIAGGDEKVGKRLGRYATPRDMGNALLSMQNRMSAGELRSVLKEGASAEEVKAWRAENGIPEAPEGYDLKMPEGIVFGDADKPVIASFVKAAHGANMHPNQVKAALAWYHQDREAQMAAMAEKDQNWAREANDALHVEWGPNYRKEVNLIEAMLGEAPKGLKEVLMAARGPDDRPLFSNLDFIHWLQGVRVLHNPTATLVGAGGEGMEANVDSELATIEKAMKDKNGEYYKGKKVERDGVLDTVMSHRYRELLGHKEALKGRGAKK